jgi:hypothetical protein
MFFAIIEERRRQHIGQSFKYATKMIKRAPCMCEYQLIDVGMGDGLLGEKCTATAIPNIYSFSGNSAASAPISTFMCLWAIYIFQGSVYIFPSAEQADPSWEYIIRSQTHECGNWDWGPDIPFLGIFVSNFRHFVFAVCICFSVTSCVHEYSVHSVQTKVS